MRTYKGYLRNEARFSPDEQHKRIKRAYNRLPQVEKYTVDDNVDSLCKELKDVGPQTALEILAAIARLTVEKEQTNGQTK